MTYEIEHGRLDEGWVLDAASGAAPQAVRVLAACQAALAPRAGVTLHAAESAFGVFLESAPRAALRPGALEAVLERLDDLAGAGEQDDVRVGGDAAPEANTGGLPGPLGRILALSASQRWRRKIGGYREIALDALAEPGVRARLLSIPAGKGAPEHDHDGDELTLVLKGDFLDGVTRYRRGDVCVAGPGRSHRPRAGLDEDCVCFVVELGALRPTNPVLATIDRLTGGRLMN